MERWRPWPTVAISVGLVAMEYRRSGLSPWLVLLLACGLALVAMRLFSEQLNRQRWVVWLGLRIQRVFRRWGDAILVTVALLPAAGALPIVVRSGPNWVMASGLLLVIGLIPG